MTREQEIFYYGKKIRDYYDIIQRKRALTQEERHILNDVNTRLWNRISGFAYQKVNNMTCNFNISTETREDIRQEVFTVFLDLLSKYNPLRSAPTTFFVFYFTEVIRKYIELYILGYSQYDLKNITSVRKAIATYESKGLSWNEEILVEETGLSLKVLKHTLLLEKNMKNAAIEDAEFLVSKTETPEESFIKTESQESLISAIKRVLTLDEYEFWMTYMNLSGTKKLTFNELSARLGISISTAKKKKRIIQDKLCMDPEISLMAQEHGINTSLASVPLNKK